jgi:gamma-glutamyl-gamma-aminobutyrate hydrolase PuuD
MLTKTQIVNAMSRLDGIILDGETEEIRVAAYAQRVQYGQMLFNHEYVY